METSAAVKFVMTNGVHLIEPVKRFQNPWQCRL